MPAPAAPPVPTPRPLPLAGIRVLELGQLLAGPFAGTLLAYFGAEVVKVEPPGDGDPIRGWRLLDDGGTSYWWRSLGRNKLCVTADLRQPAGRNLVRRLADSCQVLIENFRPGTMERWGLGPDDLAATNPGLIYTRISGYGQTGPYADRAGYASVCEAVGGLRYVTGHPGEPPVRANLSLGDTLSGFHAALGILLSLVGQVRGKSGDPGQMVDVALFESVFNCLEAVVPEFSGRGVVREPSGTTITGVVPTNLYRCRDGQHVVIGGTGEAIYRRLMAVMGRDDLAADPRLQTNAGRVEHQAEVDAAIGAWAVQHDAANVLATLDAAAVPAGPVNSVAEMVADPHFQARGLFEEVTIDGRPLTLPAILPRLTATPGRTTWPGAAVGAHNRLVWGDWFGLTDGELAALAVSGVI
jgi:crotonobetainyl-CoA:carnitine CoA-transferase CaiB-like acyl-CoA transferase